MSIRFAWSSSEFKSQISLLNFCLVDLSDIDSGMLKSPTIIVWESKSLCRFLFALRIWVVLYQAHIYLLLALLVALTPIPLCNVHVSFNLCWFKVCFIRDQDCNLSFFFLPLFHYLTSSHSGADCSVSVQLCNFE